LCKAVEEGLNERKTEREKESDGKEKRSSRDPKASAKKIRSVKAEDIDEEEEGEEEVKISDSKKKTEELYGNDFDE